MQVNMEPIKGAWDVFRRSPRWHYVDPLLFCFGIVIAAAIAITSHGTYAFYHFFLEDYLALAATVVIGVGMPMFEAGAIISDNKRDRVYFIVGLVLFSVLEATAQYWFGQSMFRSKVAEYFAGKSGVDLVSLSQDQFWGRALPIAYLAAISLIVLLLGYGFGNRFKQVRKQVADLRAGTAHEAGLQLQINGLQDALKRAQEALQEAVAQAEGKAQAILAAARLDAERTLAAVRAEYERQLDAGRAEIERLKGLLEINQSLVSTARDEVAAAREDERERGLEFARRLEAQLETERAQAREYVDALESQLQEVRRAAEEERIKREQAERQLISSERAADAHITRIEARLEELQRAAAEYPESPGDLIAQAIGGRERGGNGDGLRSQVRALYKAAWDKGQDLKAAEIAETLQRQDRLQYITEQVSRYKGELKKGGA